jgi:hypothetical protein
MHPCVPGDGRFGCAPRERVVPIRAEFSAEAAQTLIDLVRGSAIAQHASELLRLVRVLALRCILEHLGP